MVNTSPEGVNSMAGPMGRFEYLSDDGDTYTIRLDASNAAAVGATASTAPVNLPKRYRPRYILARHPTSGRERKIVVCDPAQGLFVGSTATISLPDFAATMAATTFNVAGRIGEKRLA